MRCNTINIAVSKRTCQGTRYSIAPVFRTVLTSQYAVCTAAASLMRARILLCAVTVKVTGTAFEALEMH